MFPVQRVYDSESPCMIQNHMCDSKSRGMIQNHVCDSKSRGMIQNHVYDSQVFSLVAHVYDFDSLVTIGELTCMIQRDSESRV